MLIKKCSLLDDLNVFVAESRVIFDCMFILKDMYTDLSKIILMELNEKLCLTKILIELMIKQYPSVIHWGLYLII